MEFLWRDYELQVGLYRHYLDLVLKFNGFYHVAIGAFLSFYLTRSDLSVLRYAVWLPAIMSCVFAGVLCYGAAKNTASRERIQKLAEQLGFDVWPEVRVLTAFLYATTALLLLWTIGFVLLFFYSEALVRGLHV